MSKPIRSLEILRQLVGQYEVVNRDLARGLMTLTFWLCKTGSSIQVSTEGMHIMARLSEKTIDIFPERLDTCHDRLSMNLKIDALPEAWIGECEIVFEKQYRCFPFKGITDISASIVERAVLPRKDAAA